MHTAQGGVRGIATPIQRTPEACEGLMCTAWGEAPLTGGGLRAAAAQGALELRPAHALGEGPLFQLRQGQPEQRVLHHRNNRVSPLACPCSV